MSIDVGKIISSYLLSFFTGALLYAYAETMEFIGFTFIFFLSFMSYLWLSLPKRKVILTIKKEDYRK